MTQRARVLAALRSRGADGVCSVDFLLPDVIDGHAPITRLAARVLELREDGHEIQVVGERHGCAVYRLMRDAQDTPTPVVEQLREDVRLCSEAALRPAPRKRDLRRPGGLGGRTPPSSKSGSGRLPAFIPHNSDESEIDTLGFWAYGAFNGEWSGTTCWLADAPLPEAAQGLARPLKTMPSAVAKVKDAVAEGRVTPAVLLAPVVNQAGFAMLPIQGVDFDVNPNFVAHIARTLPGGEWMLTDDLATMVDDKSREFPVLVYVIEGEARAIVSPSRVTVGEAVPDAA